MAASCSRPRFRTKEEGDGGCAGHNALYLGELQAHLRGATRVVLLLSVLLLLHFADSDGNSAVLAATSSSSAEVSLPLLISIFELPGVRDTAEEFARSLSAETGGKITVSNITYGVDRTLIFQAVKDGRAFGMGTPATFATSLGIDPLTGQYLSNDVPYGMSAVQFASLVRHTNFGTLWKRIFAPQGVRPYYAGAFLGAQFGDWYKRPIRKLSDFRGLKLRYSGNPLTGFPGSILSAVRATPVALPLAQIKPALANGTIDGLEFLGLRLDLPYRFWETGARVVHYPGLQGPEAAVFLVPSEVVAMADRPLQRASEDALSVNLAFFYGPGIQQVFDEMRRNRVRISRYPQDVVRGLYREFKRVESRHLSQVRRSNPLFASIVEEYNAYLKSTINHDIVAAPEAQQLPARDDFVARFVGVQVPRSQRSSVCS